MYAKSAIIRFAYITHKERPTVGQHRRQDPVCARPLVYYNNQHNQHQEVKQKE